jgi:predicted nucleic acid-binding protein
MPLIVISDSSPIRALHHLGLLNLCHDLYGSVIVPEAVQKELRVPTTTCPAIEITDFPGFEMRTPHASGPALGIPPDLDAGETEAIALAMELHADLLLMDERKGTQAARHLGLATIGVFGVLLEAKRKGLIDRVLPRVDRLVSELRFFASPALRQRLAELAGE